MSSDTVPCIPSDRRFIYKHPLFGNGDYRSDDYKTWRTKADRIEDKGHGTRWDNSVYYLWFEFLKRHEGYRQHCQSGDGAYAKLFADFGDVHSYGDDFRSWFYNYGIDLFAEAATPLEVIFSQHISGIEKATGTDVDNKYVYAAIPIGQTTAHSLEQIRVQLPQIKEHLKASSKASASTAKYPVARIPRIDALKTYLAVWDAVASSKTLNEAYAKVYQPLDDASVKRRGAYTMRTADQIHSARKAVYANIVARDWAKASVLVEQVSKGIFPATIPTQEQKKHRIFLLKTMPL